MSFRRYVTSLICVYLALAAAAGLASTVLLVRSDGLRDSVARLREAQLASLELESALLDQETGARGFVITGDDRFLEPYESGQLAERVAESEIRDLVDEPRVETALDDAIDAARIWREQAAEPEIATRRVDEAAALELVASGEGKELFDQSRNIQGVLEQVLAVHERTQSTELERVRNGFSFVALAALAVTALVTLTAGWIFLSRLIRPLDALTASVKAVSAGNLTGRIAASGTVEMNEVGAAVSSMRDQMVHLLQTSVAQREALEQEAILTTQLAASLAGSTAELPPRWTAATFQRPAEGVVAGDCFSVELLSPNTIALVMIDISGHGANAALQALKARTIVSAGLRTGEAPHRVVEMLSAAWTDDLFVSLFVATINTDLRRLTYANAGHPPAIVCSGETQLGLYATGPIVIPPLSGWTTNSVDLAAGDVIVIATDGLTEARRSDGEFFGEQRYMQALAQSSAIRSATADGPQRGVHDLLDELVADVETFLEGQPARDDITIVALQHDIV